MRELLALLLLFAAILGRCAAQGSVALSDVQKQLHKRETALHTFRTEWNVSVDSLNRKLIVSPFERGYWLRVETQAGSVEQEAVLLSEQPYAYIWRLSSWSSNPVVQNLTWLYGSNLLPSVAGINLLRFYDIRAHDVKIEYEERRVRVSGHLHKEFPPPVSGLPVRAAMVLLLDPERGYAPSEAFLYFNTPDQVLEKMRVLEWVNHQGNWVPAKIEFTGRGLQPLRIRLVGIRGHPDESPKWFTIPMWVSDWRLGINGSDVSAYEFKGQLPRLEELPMLRGNGKVKPTPSVPSESSKGGTSAFIFPFYSSPSVSSGTGG